VFYSKDAANSCMETIRTTKAWKEKRFRIRKVSLIKTKTWSEIG
jgi:hypothetical protein